jgi:hypothetical protein
MHPKRMASFLVVVIGQTLGLPLLAGGCGGGQSAQTGQQASPDLRANLEGSLNAASDAAKQKKTTKVK